MAFIFVLERHFKKTRVSGARTDTCYRRDDILRVDFERKLSQLHTNISYSL